MTAFWGCEKINFAAYGGKINFFRAAILTILLRKIVGNTPLKSIIWRRKPPN